MTIKELIDYGKQHISNQKVEMLLEYYLNCDIFEIHTQLNKEIDVELEKEYKFAVNKIENNYPIQYLIGKTNFYGNDFIVNKNVLIPRFETEELVENTINYIKKQFDENIKVIDLGTGSGCIGITLKKKIPNLDVTCVDISDKALCVAKENAKKLSADVKFVQSDMLDNIADKYSVIISNPPYISANEEIEEVVKKNEPHLALYARNDGLYFYDKILSTCKDKLEDKFLIAFEIGMTQKEQVLLLAKDYLGNDVTCVCKKDLSGKDRMVFIYKL